MVITSDNLYFVAGLTDYMAACSVHPVGTRILVGTGGARHFCVPDSADLSRPPFISGIT